MRGFSPATATARRGRGRTRARGCSRAARARGDAATRGDRRGILRRLGVILVGLRLSSVETRIDRERRVPSPSPRPRHRGRGRTPRWRRARGRGVRRGKTRANRPWRRGPLVARESSRQTPRRARVRRTPLARPTTPPRRTRAGAGEGRRRRGARRRRRRRVRGPRGGKEPGRCAAPEDEGRTRGIRHTATRDAQETPRDAPIAIAYSRRRPNDSTSNRGER